MKSQNYSTTQKKPNRECKHEREHEWNGYRMDTERLLNGYGMVMDHKKKKKGSLESKLYANKNCSAVTIAL